MIETDGFELEVTAIRRKPEVNRAENERPIIGQIGNVRWSTTSEALRAAITRKGSRYGELDKPFVVAVNAAHFSLRACLKLSWLEHALEAHAGHEQRSEDGHVP